MQVFVDTNQFCEEASLDVQRLVNFTKRIGHSHTTDVKKADIVIFYACGHLHKQEADSIRIIKRINQLRKLSSDFIVWGCLPKINVQSMASVYNGPSVGPEDWSFFSDYFGRPKEEIENTVANTLNVHSKLLGTSASPARRLFNWVRGMFYGRIGETFYIKVESGCRNCCTYCSDRLAYRWLKSVPIEKVTAQFEAGLRMGYKYFYLVGRDLGSYGFDVGLTLADLVNDLAGRFSNHDFKVYLTNVSPNSLIDTYKDFNSSFLSHKTYELGSHIQSGSEKILKLMGKSFSLREWTNIMENIDRSHHDVRLRTSVMVGFPGETEEDFRETANLVGNLLFDRIDVYAYDERPNIPSLRLKGRVPESVKRERYNKMRRLAAINNIRKRAKRARIFY